MTERCELQVGIRYRRLHAEGSGPDVTTEGAHGPQMLRNVVIRSRVINLYKGACRPERGGHPVDVGVDVGERQVVANVIGQDYSIRGCRAATTIPGRVPRGAV